MVGFDTTVDSVEEAVANDDVEGDNSVCPTVDSDSDDDSDPAAFTDLLIDAAALAAPMTVQSSVHIQRR